MKAKVSRQERGVAPIARLTQRNVSEHIALKPPGNGLIFFTRLQMMGLAFAKEHGWSNAIMVSLSVTLSALIKIAYKN